LLVERQNFENFAGFWPAYSSPLFAASSEDARNRTAAPAKKISVSTIAQDAWFVSRSRPLAAQGLEAGRALWCHRRGCHLVFFGAGSSPVKERR
jgi:hypothetical protein